MPRIALIQVWYASKITPPHSPRSLLSSITRLLLTTAALLLAYLCVRLGRWLAWDSWWGLQGTIKSFQLLHEPALILLILFDKADACLFLALFLLSTVILLTHLTHLARMSRVVHVFRCLSPNCNYPRRSHFWYIWILANVLETTWLIGLSRVLSNHGAWLHKTRHFLMLRCLEALLLFGLLFLSLFLFFLVVSRQRLQEIIHTEDFWHDWEVLCCIF